MCRVLHQNYVMCLQSGTFTAGEPRLQILILLCFCCFGDIYILRECVGICMYIIGNFMILLDRITVRSWIACMHFFIIRSVGNNWNECKFPIWWWDCGRQWKIFPGRPLPNLWWCGGTISDTWTAFTNNEGYWVFKLVCCEPLCCWDIKLILPLCCCYVSNQIAELFIKNKNKKITSSFSSF